MRQESSFDVVYVFVCSFIVSVLFWEKENRKPSQLKTMIAPLLQPRFSSGIPTEGAISLVRTEPGSARQVHNSFLVIGGCGW